MSNYLAQAALMLLVYDHVITLDKEVDWIWTLRWRLPKILFLINRYLITSLVLVAGLANFIFPLSVNFCNFHQYLVLFIQLMSFATVELILIVRVCTLYGFHKLAVWSLGCIYFAALISAIVGQVLFGKTWQTIRFYEGLPGCWLNSSSQHIINQWHVWAAFLSVEGILIFLTLYKIFSYRNELNRTITVLARDSILYFIVVFACLATVLAADIHRNIRISFQLPAQCMSSVAVGRMIMNIRGLVMDNSEHSVTTPLQTIRFASRTNMSAGVETDV